MGKLTIDENAWARLVAKASTESAERAAAITKRRIEANIASSGRIDTGAMLKSFRVKPMPSSTRFTRYAVYSDLHYTLYQEYGTRGYTVKPGGKVLRFKPKGSGSFIFRMSVGPIAPARFMRRAVDQMLVSDFIA